MERGGKGHGEKSISGLRVKKDSPVERSAGRSFSHLGTFIPCPRIASILACSVTNASSNSR